MKNSAPNILALYKLYSWHIQLKLLLKDFKLYANVFSVGHGFLIFLIAISIPTHLNFAFIAYCIVGKHDNENLTNLLAKIFGTNHTLYNVRTLPKNDSGYAMMMLYSLPLDPLYALKLQAVLYSTLCN